MLKRLGTPLFFAFSCVVVTACGGGGGSAVPPSQATAWPQTSAPPLGRRTRIKSLITTSGQITEYTIPTSNSGPWQIVGPGSGRAAFTLWFAETGSGKIAMVRYQ